MDDSIARPTSVRATISEDEWTLFRSLALVLNVSASDLLGETIRSTLAKAEKMGPKTLLRKGIS